MEFGRGKSRIEILVSVEKKKYELTKTDCIGFFIDVAGLFSDLLIPDRKKYV